MTGKGTTASPGTYGWPDAIVGGCPAGSAKFAGTLTTPPDTSSDRIEPGASVVRASGAPKFDVLATSSRVRSRTGWLALPNAPLVNGPALWNVPTCVIA